LVWVELSTRSRRTGNFDLQKFFETIANLAKARL